MNKSIDTPCVGVCSTVYGDTVCRGCKRLYQEIIDWNGYEESAKRVVLERLSQNMSRVVRIFLEVVNADLLLQELHQHGIRYHSHDPYCWAHHLLRVRATKIMDIHVHGILIKPEFENLSLIALFTLIDKKLYEVAQAESAVEFS